MGSLDLSCCTKISSVLQTTRPGGSPVSWSFNTSLNGDREATIWRTFHMASYTYYLYQSSKRIDNSIRPQIFNKQHFCPLVAVKKISTHSSFFASKHWLWSWCLIFVESCLSWDWAQGAGFNLLGSHIRKLLLPHQISGSRDGIIHLSGGTEGESDFAAANGAVQMAQCLQRGRNIVFWSQ